MKHYSNFIDNSSEWIGRIIALIVMVMMFAIVYEVVARYVFNEPTVWVHEVSSMLWGAMFILGGAYCFKHKGMVNVDIFHNRLSPRGRAIADAICFLFLLIVCGTIIFYASRTALHSIEINEHSQTVFSPPLYPIRLIIPIGAFLLLLQGLAQLNRDIYFAITGRSLK